MYLSLESVVVRHVGARADHAAVDGVSLGLAAGQIGVLIGPSGCGKTTLLRAVAGLEPLAGGRIRMDGRLLGDAVDGTQVPAESRRIGMVFQDYALFPHLSVADNVAFGVQDLPRTERSARVQRMLELVGLSQAARRAPHQLSGGQQQRIALARALAPGPRLLLLDEPFSNLDVDLRERLAHEVRGILKAAGGTTPTRCTTGRRRASSRNSSATACSRRPASTRHARPRPAAACTPCSARSKTSRNARCPRPIRAATATCCCVPTTSCTTTPAR